MKTKIIIFIALLAVLLAVLLAFINGKNKELLAELCEMRNNKPEASIEIVRDTVRDTVRIRTPYPVDRTPIEKIPTPETDSIEIEQVVYSDSTFTAWISGYMPKMDSIEFVTTVIKDSITVYQPYRLPVRKRGIFIGLGKKGYKDRYFGIGYIEY